MAEGCVHDLVWQRAALAPDEVALIDGTSRLRLGQVCARAEAIAAALIERVPAWPSWPAARRRVGVACTRGADMIAAVLAALRAGGAYVPIDPRGPPARLQQLAEDAELPAILHNGALPAELAPLGLDVRSALPAAAARWPTASPEDPCMVLYTSGSTGSPKGVVCPHRAVVARLRWQRQAMPYEPGEVACARTALGFVDSVAEIFAPLCEGVPLVIVDDDAQRDLRRTVELLAEHDASRVVMVPSLLAALLELAEHAGWDLAARLPRARWWFLGGEAVPVPLVHRFAAMLPGRQLVNLYGATETTGDATAGDLSRVPRDAQSAPIGVPITGTYARVLDEHGAEVPDGATGELAVSGACLALGYLGRPELTAQRFAANPFPEGGALYRTGDLARRLPDGALTVLGRRDQQVKIRGVRVELAEVEAALVAVPGVSAAVALAREGALIAYYCGAALPTAVRAALAVRLPDAMVPTTLAPIETFPISPNGKIDRRALAERPVPAPAIGTAAPAPAMAAVAASWQRILLPDAPGHPDVDADFRDLGGTSLHAMRLAAALAETYARDVSLADIFAHPTIAALAAHLGPPANNAPPPSRPAATSAHLLTPHQLPFWLARALTGARSTVVEIFGFSPATALRASDDELARIRAAFAATVAELDELWVTLPRLRPVSLPHVGPRPAVPLPLRDCATLEAEVADLFGPPFDLTAPPLLRARLVRLPDESLRLLIGAPHDVADMTSFELFRLALQRHLRGAPPPPPSPPTPAPRPMTDAARSHWRSLAGTAPCPLPPRFRAKAARVPTFTERTLSPDDELRLTRAAHAAGATMPMALILAIARGLAHTLERDDVTLLLMLEQRAEAAWTTRFGTRAVPVPVRLAGASLAQARDLLLASYQHADALAQHPALWNDFWRRAPLARRALLAAGSALARLWPAAALPRHLLGELCLALLPPPRRGGARDVLLCVNLLPEVTADAAPASTALCVVRQRTFWQLLRPTDLVPGADFVLDRTLQLHVTRDAQHRLCINLYGAGLARDALEHIAASITDAVRALAS